MQRLVAFTQANVKRFLLLLRRLVRSSFVSLVPPLSAVPAGPEPAARHYHQLESGEKGAERSKAVTTATAAVMSRD